MFGDINVSATAQRFHFQEDFRHAIAHVLVVDDLTAPGAAASGAWTSPTNCLLDSSMQTSGNCGS